MNYNRVESSVIGSIDLYHRLLRAVPDKDTLLRLLQKMAPKTILKLYEKKSDAYQN